MEGTKEDPSLADTATLSSHSSGVTTNWSLSTIYADPSPGRNVSFYLFLSRPDGPFKFNLGPSGDLRVRRVVYPFYKEGAVSPTEGPLQVRRTLEDDGNQNFGLALTRRSGDVEKDRAVDPRGRRGDRPTIPTSPRSRFGALTVLVRSGLRGGAGG